jgi:hypothetical protein
MTLAECSFSAFAILNIARVVAYIPQVMRVYADDNGAKAVSITTWSLFAGANLTTASYALISINDSAMALVFALNTLGCLTIVAFTIWKRFRPGIGNANGKPSGATASPLT